MKLGGLFARHFVENAFEGGGGQAVDGGQSNGLYHPKVPLPQQVPTYNGARCYKVVVLTMKIGVVDGAGEQPQYLHRPLSPSTVLQLPERTSLLPLHGSHHMRLTSETGHQCEFNRPAQAVWHNLVG